MLSRLFAIFLAAAFIIPVTAEAAPEAIRKVKDWTVFKDRVDGETICYAATEATDKAPKSTDHGEVWFLVTNWQSGKARNQPSLKVNYELRGDLPGRAKVGRGSWSLFGVGREGFVRDADDAKLVRALKRGSELRVETISGRNTQVTYHFSLSGSATAIDRAAALCR